VATEFQTEEAVPAPRRPRLEVGVVAAPRLARDIDARLIGELEADLRNRYDTVDWKLELRFDRLVSPPATGAALVDAARRAMLDEGWDLALVVTDIPLRHDRRAVSTQASRTHRVAVVSLPALGTLHVRRRLRQTLLELVGALAAEQHDGAPDAAMHQRLRQLSGRSGARRNALGVVSTISLTAGHARLLVGMIRANRPWRLAARLYGALVPALAAGAYGVVTPEIWGISATLSWLRLLATALASIAVTIVVLIVVHELWERAPDRQVRDQVVLFNVATAATVTIGILTLYVALFMLILLAAGLVITPGTLAAAIGRRARFDDYLVLAWFVASLATIGGALGGALESDETVREAAYSASPAPVTHRRVAGARRDGK
jgi:uncharacterized membrane protein